eukprot:2594861-Amphidinium_carterae.1
MPVNRSRRRVSRTSRIVMSSWTLASRPRRRTPVTCASYYAELIATHLSRPTYYVLNPRIGRQ